MKSALQVLLLVPISCSVSVWGDKDISRINPLVYVGTLRERELVSIERGWRDQGHLTIVLGRPTQEA